ncbi:MAG TPA: hypothetical protein VGM58_04180 [Verrucomicrobiae bacterium]|jgi:hypothetical protein
MIAEEKYGHYKEYCRQREECIKAAIEISGRYDKWILTLSAGALAISLTFLEKISPTIAQNTLFLIGWSWALLILALIAGILAILTSQYYIQKQIKDLDAHYEACVQAVTENKSISEKYNNSNPGWNFLCHAFTIASAIFFILGLIFLCCFAYANLPRNATAVIPETKTNELATP